MADSVATGPQQGRCQCGAVRVIATPRALDVCHCAMCRRLSSGPMFAMDTGGAMEVEGGDAVRVYKSSDWAERVFCGVCGTPLWYRLTMDGPHGGHIMPAAGLFDDFAGLALSKEIFIDAKPGGYSFAGDRPRLTEAETIAAFTAVADHE